MYLEYYKIHYIHIYIFILYKKYPAIVLLYTKLVYLKSAKLELIIGANFVRNLF